MGILRGTVNGARGWLFCVFGACLRAFAPAFSFAACVHSRALYSAATTESMATSESMESCGSKSSESSDTMAWRRAVERGWRRGREQDAERKGRGVRVGREEDAERKRRTSAQDMVRRRD